MNPRLRAYFELLRFPAVFTVVADVVMGYLVAGGDSGHVALLALLVAGSSFLYLAGMVLNDVYDMEIDAHERPERPIPSGRISRPYASRIGWGLLFGGLAAIWSASSYIGQWIPGVIGSLLAGWIWVYDAYAKRSPLAMFIMAGCRMLNLILAMSLAALATAPQEHELATDAEKAIVLGAAIYVAGVSWFARSEARTSMRWGLGAGMITMLAGLALYAASPFLDHLRPALTTVSETGWVFLWLAIAAVILRRCALAVARPESSVVQMAVRSSLRSLIVIDAAVVLAFCGSAWAWGILAMLIPMLLLERWISTT